MHIGRSMPSPSISRVAHSRCLAYRDVARAGVLALLTGVLACGGERPTEAKPSHGSGLTFRLVLPSGTALDTLTWTGAPRTLGAQVVDTAGKATPMAATWASRDTTVARVSQDGVVTAQDDGATWVLALATVAGVSTSDSARVVVHRQPGRLELRDTYAPPPGNVFTGSTPAFTLPVVQKRQLAAAVLDSGGRSVPSSATVAWQSSHPEFISVDATGLVTAVAPGATTVTASIPAGAGTVTASVAVSTYVRALTIDTDTIDVGVGQLTTTAYAPGPGVRLEAFGSGETVVLSLTASDTSVVSVPAQVSAFEPSTNGSVVGLAFAGRRPGLARVTITAPGFTAASTVVRVTSPRLHLGYWTVSDPTITALAGTLPFFEVVTFDGRGHPRRVAAQFPLIATSSDSSVVVPQNDPAGRMLEGDVDTNLNLVAQAPGRAWLRVSAAGYPAESLVVNVTRASATPRLQITGWPTYNGVSLVGVRQVLSPQQLVVSSSVPPTVSPIPDVTVTFTQRHPEVARIPASLPLRPDLTTGLRAFGWSGLAVGADTVVASAPGFEPVTFELRVTTPRLLVQGAPTSGRVTAPGTFTVTVGDSTGAQHIPLDGPIVLTATPSDPALLQVVDPVSVGTTSSGSFTVRVRFLDVGSGTVTLSDPAGRYASVTLPRVTIVSTAMVVAVGGETPGTGGTARATLGMTQRLAGANRATVIPSGGSVYDTDLRVRSSESRLVQAQLLPVEPNANGQRSVALTGGDTTGSAWVVFTAPGLQADSVRVDVGRGALGVGPVTPAAGRRAFVAGDTVTVGITLLDPVGRVRPTDQAFSVLLTSTDTTVAVPVAEPVVVPAGATGTTARVRLRGPGTAVLRAQDARTGYARASDGVSGAITVVAP